MFALSFFAFNPKEIFKYVVLNGVWQDVLTENITHQSSWTADTKLKLEVFYAEKM